MAGLVVFCCPQVLLKIPPVTFTNEEYASLHFVYGSCDVNCKDASVEYNHCYPGCRIHWNIFQNVHKMTGSIPNINAEHG